jgi:WD40 repeat protein
VLVSFLVGEARAAPTNPSSPSPTPFLVIDSGGHTARINEILFTHDGRHLVSTGADKVVRIWDLELGKTVRTLRGEIEAGDHGKIEAAALSPDDHLLAIGGYLPSFALRLHDFQTGEVLGVLAGHQDVALSLAFSPDGRMLASASADKTIRLWDVASRRTLHVLRGHEGPVRTVAFSPDGARVLSGSEDHTLRLWKAKTGKLIREMRGHADQVWSAAFSPDGRYLASGGLDRQIRIWETATGSFVKDLVPGQDGVARLAFTPDGQRLLVGDDAPQQWRPGADRVACTVLSVATGKIIARLAEHDDSVRALAISPDGRLAATNGGSDEKIYVWDVATGTVLHTLAGHGRSIWRVGFASDGASIAFGTNSRRSLEKTFLLVDRGSQLAGYLAGDVVSQDAYWSDMGMVYPSFVRPKAEDHRVIQFISQDGKLIREIRLDPRSEKQSYLAWSLGSTQRFDSGGDYGALTIFDYESGHPVLDLIGHTDSIESLATSLDGKRIVSGSRDQTVRLWDLTTGTNLLSIFMATDGEWVAWTPQGYYTSSLHGDRYIGWQVNQGAEHAAAYYPEAQFHEQFFLPGVVAEYLKDGNLQQALARADARCGPRLEPPVIHVVEPERDGIEVNEETLRIRAAALSNNLPITDLRITFNGMPISGLAEGSAKANAAGPSEGHATGNPLEREIEAEETLQPGDNVITFQAAHAKARSQAVVRHVRYRAPPGARPAQPAKANLILLAVGISNYTDPALKLNWADEDAQEVEQTFRRQEGRLFGHLEARVLTTARGRAGRAEILAALDWFQRQGAPGDVRLLFLSGHGAVDARGDFYFLSQDQTADGNPDGDGVRWSRLLDSLTAGNVRPVLMIDTCHAAAAARGPVATRFDLTRTIRQTYYPGLFSFFSSPGTAPSHELKDWRHGAFTQALLEGLSGKADRNHDGQVDTYELGDWIRTRVPVLTRGEQHADFDSGEEGAAIPLVETPPERP